MPIIDSELIQDIPHDWAMAHPVITVGIDTHPYGWALEAWTMGRRILRDDNGNGATYSMSVPKPVTRAIYGWLNSIAPIWTAPGLHVCDDMIGWEDATTGLAVLAYQDTIGPLEVSLIDPKQPDTDCLAIALVNHDATMSISSTDDMRQHIARVADHAHKYFYPN